MMYVFLFGILSYYLLCVVVKLILKFRAELDIRSGRKWIWMMYARIECIKIRTIPIRMNRNAKNQREKKQQMVSICYSESEIY